MHAIRKTVISELGEAGVLSPEELKRFAGHNDITTTDRYYVCAVNNFGSKAGVVESVLAMTGHE